MKHQPLPDLPDKKYQESVTQLRKLLEAHKHLDKNAVMTGPSANGDQTRLRLLRADSFPKSQYSANGRTSKEASVRSKGWVDEEPVRDRSQGDSRKNTYKSTSPQKDNGRQQEDHLQQFIIHQEALVQQLHVENRLLRASMTSLNAKVYQLIDDNNTLSHRVGRELVGLTADDLQPLLLRGGGPISPASSIPTDVNARKIAEDTGRQIEECRSEVAKLEKMGERQRVELEEQTVRVQKASQEAERLNQALGRAHDKQRESERREQEALEKVKESVRISEQAQLEAREAENRCLQLRRSLEDQERRTDQMIINHERRVVTERETAGEAVKKELVVLVGKITDAEYRTTQLELEKEQWERKQTELREEIQRQQSDLTQARRDAERAGDQHQRQLTELDVQRSQIEVELSTTKAMLEGLQRDHQDERDNHLREVSQLKKQLQVSQTDLQQRERDRLQLQHQMNQLEKKLAELAHDRELIERRCSADLRAMSSAAEKREQELIEVIDSLQAADQGGQTQLENMVKSQNALLQQLQTECSDLCTQLSSAQLSSQQATSQLSQLRSRLAASETACHELKSQCEHQQRMRTEEQREKEHAQQEMTAQNRRIMRLASRQQELANERQQLLDQLTVSNRQ